MTINMTRNPKTGTYEYKPKPKWVPRLNRKELIESVIPGALVGWIISSLF